MASCHNIKVVTPGVWHVPCGLAGCVLFVLTQESWPSEASVCFYESCRQGKRPSGPHSDPWSSGSLLVIFSLAKACRMAVPDSKQFGDVEPNYMPRRVWTGNILLNGTPGDLRTWVFFFLFSFLSECYIYCEIFIWGGGAFRDSINRGRNNSHGDIYTFLPEWSSR